MYQVKYSIPNALTILLARPFIDFYQCFLKYYTQLQLSGYLGFLLVKPIPLYEKNAVRNGLWAHYLSFQRAD